MIEIHNRNSGAVTRDCQCTPTAETTEPPTDVLPPECYSPRGDNCDWYRNCLEVRYPCQNSPDGYAIEFAEMFCKLYSERFNDFSSTGRAWINAVRKCLQVSMVPFMRPWVVKTCADIKREAFNSHPNCYLSPGSGAPGIYSLPLTDMLKSFWLVNFEGGALYDAPVETGSQMFFVMRRCLDQWNSNIFFATATRILYLALPFPPKSTILVYRIVKYVAEKQHWKQNGFRWFPLQNFTSDVEMYNRNKRQVSTDDRIITVEGAQGGSLSTVLRA